MNNNGFESKNHSWFIFILLILSYFFLMFGNGMISLTHPDEVFYIQSAKEMVQHGRWFTPMIFDHVQFEKPFLSFALFAATIKWFGLSPFVARFWPAFFGIVGVLTVYWIAWLLFERKRLAFLSGLILTTSFIYIALSRAVLTDMIFSTFVAISIGFFCLAYFRPQCKSLGLILCGSFSAIAVLTKGLLGFSFPAATIIIFLVLKRDWEFLKTPATLWAAGLFLLIAVPWHAVMFAQHGSWFWDEYFKNVHFRRFTEAEHQRLNHGYFYPGLMFAGVMPWSLFWVPVIVSIIHHIKNKTSSQTPIFFLLSWIMAVFIFIQPAASKLASYVFPLFPAVAILFAKTFHDLVDNSQGKKNLQQIVQWCAYAMSLVLIVVAIIGIVVAGMHRDFIISMAPVYAGAGFLVMIAALIFIFTRRRDYIRVIGSYVGISVVLLIMLRLAGSYLEPWVSCKKICDVLKRMDQSNTTVLSSKFYVRGVRYYTDRPMAVIDINGQGFWSPHPIPFLNTDQEVRDFLNQQPVTYAIVKEGNVEDLKRIIEGQRYRLQQIEVIGGKYLVKVEKTSP